MRIPRNLLLALCLVLASSASAEDFPSKPIRLIVPFPPGGPNDIIARVVGQRMSEICKQPVLIDNRGGQAGSKGAGLGLSIVRRLVDQMHGTLALESEPGRGTCFRIELPSAIALAPSAGADDAALRGRRVLVVDDDPDIAQLLEVLLSDLGFDVRLLDDAEAALDGAMREAPDILLVDVELPGMSGNAVVYQLRAQGYGGAIVTLSANASTDARDASLRAGANYYLTKPLELERFVATMRRAIAQGAKEPT